MFPKIIWRYWDQGWDNAPYMIKDCTKSIEYYAPDFEINNLDKNNINDFIKLPNELETIPDIPMQCTSDIIRLLLLKKYGGIWIDATVFMNMNLANFIEQYNYESLFFFRWENKTAVSNWFICANKNSYIIEKLSYEFQKSIFSSSFLKENEKYFKKWRGTPNYFIFHKTFEKLTKEDVKFGELVKNMPFVDSFSMLSTAFYGWNKDVCNEIEDNIYNKSPMIKISYSVPENKYNKNSALEKLKKKLNGDNGINYPHLHLSMGLRTTNIYNSFVNSPAKVSQWAGQFESESDLELCPEKYPRYHIYNFSSIDSKNGAQLLIPYGANRIFIRSQIKDKFSSPRELAYKEEIDALKKEIISLKNTFFWEKFIDQIINELPDDIFPSFDFTKNYIQFFIDGIDHSIHYELLRKDNSLFFCIHCENEKLSKDFYDDFKTISNIIESNMDNKNNCLYINKPIDKINIVNTFLLYIKLTKKYIKLLREREQ